MPPGPAYNWFCVLYSTAEILSNAARYRAAQLTPIASASFAHPRKRRRTEGQGEKPDELVEYAPVVKHDTQDVVKDKKAFEPALKRVDLEEVQSTKQLYASPVLEPARSHQEVNDAPVLQEVLLNVETEPSEVVLENVVRPNVPMLVDDTPIFFLMLGTSGCANAHLSVARVKKPTIFEGAIITNRQAVPLWR
ncbi:hypothetical protein GALMADRAFT_1304879 [Galerina marginata CBS 339.88]|uniref:Uncharacterized protein n=1 Tax=Galerina marginata (strain CBS 339.88) TaxID=685588 RepID=A0A067T738_GALM3|nr:hypothetical protein GALMADRAFT_1304879 [Galerina marginata CBS 339.88]